MIYIFDKNMNIWFGLRDIILVLEYKNYEKAITNINISKSNKMTFNKLEISKNYKDIKSHKIFINETGLCELLKFSNKPRAMIFMNNYFRL
jgi:prophage antirepressor-like protein